MLGIALPRFSVVMPVHNKAPHISAALQSIFDQTVVPHEVIVVDDASTDDSIDHVRSFDLPNIRILERAARGAGGYAARNLAIERATGEWIAFLDADDTWKPNHLETISSLALGAPEHVGCVFCGFEFLEPSGRVRRDPYSSRHRDRGPTRVPFSRFLDDWIENKSCPIWTGACSFKRSTLIGAGLFPADRCRRGGDKDLWLRTMTICDAIAVSTITASYNRRAINMVTRIETMGIAPCMCHTYPALLSRSSRDDAVRLKKVLNLEIFNYVYGSLKNGRLTRDMFKDFFVSINPLLYCMIIAMWISPQAIVGAAKRAVNIFRSFQRDFTARKRADRG